MTFQNCRLNCLCCIHPSSKHLHHKTTDIPNGFVCHELAYVTDNARMCAIREYKVWLSRQMLSVSWNNSHSRQRCRYEDQSFERYCHKISFDYIIKQIIRSKMKDLVNGNHLIENNTEQNHAHGNGVLNGDR